MNEAKKKALLEENKRARLEARRRVEALKVRFEAGEFDENEYIAQMNLIEKELFPQS